MEKVKMEGRPIIIALKGHPGTGKSTLAHCIASSLNCPLVDKDDVRDCTETLQFALAQSSPAAGRDLLNELSYDVVWRFASTQLRLGLSIVVDSPLSRRIHFEQLRRLAEASGAGLVVVECKPNDEAEWRRRLERRGAADDGASWHKPSTWREMERLLEGYGGCTEYDVGEVPKLVLDTTANVGIAEMVSSVLQFVITSA